MTTQVIEITCWVDCDNKTAGAIADDLVTAAKGYIASYINAKTIEVIPTVLTAEQYDRANEAAIEGMSRENKNTD